LNLSSIFHLFFRNSIGKLSWDYICETFFLASKVYFLTTLFWHKVVRVLYRYRHCIICFLLRLSWNIQRIVQVKVYLNFIATPALNGWLEFKIIIGHVVDLARSAYNWTFNIYCNHLWDINLRVILQLSPIIIIWAEKSSSANFRRN